MLLIPLMIQGIAAFPLNPPAWSASIEYILNIIHGTIIYKISNRPIILLIILLSIFSLVFFPPGNGVDRGVWGGEFLWAISRGLISYPLGIVLWRVWKDKPAVSMPSEITFFAMPILMLASAPVAKGYHILDLAFILAFCPILLAGGLSVAPNWGRFLGAISFPLYAIHVPLIKWAGDDLIPRVLAGAFAVLLCCIYELFGKKIVNRLKFRG